MQTNQHSKIAERELTPIQYHILSQCDEGDTYYPFGYFVSEGYTIEQIKTEVRNLASLGVMKFARGLMTEEGEVAGSGYGVTYIKMQEVREMCQAYVNKGKPQDALWQQICDIVGDDNQLKATRLHNLLIEALQTAERRGEERERERTEKLWDLLDSIDLLPDMIHPRDAAGHEKCWKMMIERAEKRHEVLQSDGYSLKPTSEEEK